MTSSTAGERAAAILLVAAQEIEQHLRRQLGVVGRHRLQRIVADAAVAELECRN